jgi:hypothetical protein
MSDGSNQPFSASAPDPQKASGTDRRTFLAVASASLLGGAALLAPSAAAEDGIPGATEIARPKDLGPRGMIDNRYPVTFAECVPKACQVITGYFTALSQRDLKGMAEYMHYPFATFEGVEAVQVKSPEELLAKAPPSMNMSTNPERFTDHDSYMKAGSYDIFEGFEVLCMDPVVVGVSMSYNRFDSNGKMLSRCEGVYSITNNDGKWGIQLVSTIFTPAMQVGIVYPDAVNAANRLRIDHDLSYQMSDRRVEPIPQIGTSANVTNYAGQPWSLAPNGKVMDQFKVAGVTSRLRYSDGSQPRPHPEPSANPLDDYADYRELFHKNGLGGWGWVYGVLPNSRILHQTFNKVHQFTGAVRFNQAGELASYNTDIGIVTYKLGRWGTSGSVCYTTPHDRSNDVMKA